jgi:Phage terminase large subunit/Terminase RNaseH-like domain
MPFSLTQKQEEANALLASDATHIMLSGGSRSGKSLVLIRAIVIRALKAPGSRHGVFRFRFGHLKQSMVHDTFPKVMNLCFPSIHYDINKTDWFATLPGASEIWFSGLDDAARVEKVLGKEFVTIFLEECSQIPYNSRNVAVTRLAQLVRDSVTKAPLQPKMYYAQNPPDKGHWSYKLFCTHQDPETKQSLPDPRNFGFLRLNPADNQQNLSADYIKTLESLPVRLRKRFLEGEFRDAAPNALFSDEAIERWRVIDQALPDMLRIVVAVDPSGAEDEESLDNDEIGIVICGLGVDGNGYVLEDLTCRAGPAVWGKVATDAFDRHRADRIVAEVNFGGAMVGAVIRSARPRTPYRAVTASRGKAVRAEPIAGLIETGRIRMAGIFRELEDELCAFTTHGYMGEASPNRADALIWACSDLFPELTKGAQVIPQSVPPPFIHRQSSGWMHR